MFATHYSRKKSVPEKGGGERLVEVAGYVSAQKRIESLIMAGRRLVESRIEQYDSVNDDFDAETFFDPTRSKNFDLSDATESLMGIQTRRRTVSKAPESPQDGSDSGIKDVVTPAE